MTDNELLLAISDIMDKKLQPINEQLEEHNRKFEVIDRRFDAVDKRFDAMDERLDSMDRRLKKVELVQENTVLPKLQNIEACYTSTYDRYRTGLAKLDAMQADIAVIKSVVSEHSEKLKKIS